MLVSIPELIPIAASAKLFLLNYELYETAALFHMLGYEKQSWLLGD